LIRRSRRTNSSLLRNRGLFLRIKGLGCQRSQNRFLNHVRYISNVIEELLPGRKEILRSGKERKVPFRTVQDSSLDLGPKDRDCVEPPVQKSAQKNPKIEIEIMTFTIITYKCIMAANLENKEFLYGFCNSIF
jgi:hypothetical protein